MPVVAGQRHVGAGRGHALLAVVAREAFEQGQAAIGGPDVAQILAAEHAEGQGRIGQQPDLFTVRKLGQADLEAAVEQRVRVLDAGDAWQAGIA